MDLLTKIRLRVYSKTLLRHPSSALIAVGNLSIGDKCLKEGI